MYIRVEEVFWSKLPRTLSKPYLEKSCRLSYFTMSRSPLNPPGTPSPPQEVLRERPRFCTVVDSAELSRSVKSFGPSSEHAEIGPESFGIVVHRSAGTAQGILGLVWLRSKRDSGSESKIHGRILTSFRGPCSFAKMMGRQSGGWRASGARSPRPPQPTLRPTWGWG